jgi:methylthioribose-1-phosphate isomerase
MHPVINWKDNTVIMLDQRRLPGEEVYITHHTYHEVAASIKEMAIRGAPAIGVAAAMGIALGMLELADDAPRAQADAHFEEVVRVLGATRPTAVNLFWAIARLRAAYARLGGSLAQVKQALVAEAQAVDNEDVAINRRIGAHGQELLQSGMTVLTHCNAGALATAGYGTALGVVRAAIEAGKEIRVIADETRPYLQGARLTVWELQQDHIPVTLITDNMAAHVMKQGRVQAVIVGADRIARNGDAANKIGTYGVAILAKYHHIPFYVAAPLSTIDFAIPDGSHIPIEERHKDEVLCFRDQRIARPETAVCNPSFDVTPANLISAIITEKGVITPEFGPQIAAWAKK